MHPNHHLGGHLMGYDCTLHVVDASLIRDRFVPRLLGATNEKSSFDNRDDAEELWTTVRTALQDETPDAAASLVCQLAITYAAADLPYHYQRGFCISLWENAPGGTDDFPVEFIGDPADLFTALTAAYPRLAGLYPRVITENWCPGVYVPADRVPQLLEWVEQQAARHPPGTRKIFSGLVKILREAATRRLAYWEGTEIPVVWKPFRSPRPARRTDLETFSLPRPASPLSRRRCGDSLLLDTYDEEGGKSAPLWLDLATWPPRVEELPHQLLSAARSRAGTWALVVITSPDRENFMTELRLCSTPASPDYRVLTMRDVPPTAYVKWIGFLGEQVVAEYCPGRRMGDARTPMLQVGDALRHAEGIPPGDCPINYRAVVQLADGADVLLWDDIGYELSAGRFINTFEVGDDRELGGEFVPAGSDGFFYIHNRQIHEVHRHAAHVLHAHHLTNAMTVDGPPNGPLLIREGDTEQGDLGKIYLPAENACIRLKPDLFDDEDEEVHPDLFWFNDHLLALSRTEIRRLPIASVLSLPRIPVPPPPPPPPPPKPRAPRPRPWWRLWP